MGFFRELIIKIKGDTKNYNKSVDTVQKKTSGLSNAIQKYGAAIKVAFTIAAVAVIAFAKKAVDAYDQQVKAEASLKTALGGREDMMRRIAMAASELQKKTLFGDEKSIEAASRLAQNIGANEKALKQLLPLVADFASAKGMDMATTADLVGKTLASSTNLLSRYGLQIEGAVGSAERLDSVTKALTKAFGGQAEAVALVGKGPLTQLKNTLGDVTEEFGRVITETEGWSKAIGFLKKDLEKFLVLAKGAIGTGREQGTTILGDLLGKSKDLDDYTANINKAIGIVERKLAKLQDQLDNTSKLKPGKRSDIETQIQIATGALNVLREGLKNANEDLFAETGVNRIGLIEEVQMQIDELTAKIPTLTSKMDIGKANDELQELNDKLKELQELSLIRGDDFNIKPLEAIPPAMLAVKDATDQARESMDNWVAAWTENAMPEIEAVIQNFDHMLQDFLTDSVATFAEGIGTALSGQGSFEDGLNNLLLMVADWAGNFGKMLIAAGFAASAFQKALATNPPLAIAAGAALVAAAALVKGALSQNPMKGKGASTGGGGSRKDSGDFLEGFRQLTPDLKVTVDGRIVASGNQLAVVLENETRRRNF